MKLGMFLMLFGLFEPSLAVELKVSNDCNEPIWMATQPNNGKPELHNSIVRVNQGNSFTYQVCTLSF